MGLPVSLRERRGEGGKWERYEGKGKAGREGRGKEGGREGGRERGRR
jgi:hypothetical protein